MDEEFMHYNEFIKMAKYRKLIYDFFSKVYAQKADKLFLEQLMQDNFLDFMAGFCERENSLNKLKKIIIDIIQDDRSVKEISNEFAGIFQIPAPGKFVPSFADFYLQNVINEVNMPDKSRNALEPDASVIGRLETLYNSFKFELKNNEEVFLKRADHISYIFGFMGMLIYFEERHQKTPGAFSVSIKDILKEEFDFFSNYIANWVILFTSEVIKKAKEPYYVEMANLTESFILSEKRDFETVLSHN